MDVKLTIIFHAGKVLFSKRKMLYIKEMWHKTLVRKLQTFITFLHTQTQL